MLFQMDQLLVFNVREIGDKVQSTIDWKKMDFLSLPLCRIDYQQKLCTVEVKSILNPELCFWVSLQYFVVFQHTYPTLVYYIKDRERGCTIWYPKGYITPESK